MSQFKKIILKTAKGNFVKKIEIVEIHTGEYEGVFTVVMDGLWHTIKRYNKNIFVIY